jgi:hypothetical protein
MLLIISNRATSPFGSPGIHVRLWHLADVTADPINVR